jgi:hypothetical protein
LTALKNLLPRVPLDNQDQVVAASNFFTNIQPNMRKDNMITDNMEAENEFLEKYPDLQCKYQIICPNASVDLPPRKLRRSAADSIAELICSNLQLELG